jgi:methionine aminopeptidase
MIEIKTKEEINLMKKACGIVSSTLCHLKQYVKPGVETIVLDDKVCYLLYHKLSSLN